MSKLAFSSLKIPNFNLVWGLLVTITISLLMVLVSFVIFLNSEAYQTIKQISAAEDALKNQTLEGLDTKSPIRATEIEDYSNALPQRVKNIDDNADFGEDALSNATLGL